MADPVVGITNGVPTSGTGTITTLGLTLIDGANATHGITTGAAVTTDAAGTFQQYLRGLVKLFTAITVKAASTAPVATDPALVVSISPNGQNANLNVDPNSGVAGHFGAPVAPLDYYSQYETVAASATDQIMGATGAQYDYIAGVLIVPGTVAAGAVSVKDGNGSAISVFAGGGVTALTDLKPFMVPLGLYALAATTPGWKLTTGTNVTAIGIGKFT